MMQWWRESQGGIKAIDMTALEVVYDRQGKVQFEIQFEKSIVDVPYVDMCHNAR